MVACVCVCERVCMCVYIYMSVLCVENVLKEVGEGGVAGEGAS